MKKNMYAAVLACIAFASLPAQAMLRVLRTPRCPSSVLPATQHRWYVNINPRKRLSKHEVKTLKTRRVRTKSDLKKIYNRQKWAKVVAITGSIAAVGFFCPVL